MPISSLSREKKILEYLQSHKNASIQDFVDLFGVSNMTIHRDLDKLEKAGHVQKKHGGVVLAEKSVIASGRACDMCGKSVSERTKFLLKFENDEEHHACCSHCGLMLQSREKLAWHSFATDYLHGHMISANQAVYLIESEISLCCVPSILSFGSRLEAEKFQKGFGGKLISMDEAVHHLQGMMHAGHA